MRLGSFNVRTLNEQSDGVNKLDQLQHDLERYQIDICCISETKLRGQGEICYKDWKLLHSGATLGKKQHGVAIMINRIASQSLVNVRCVSDRLMAASFSLPKGKMHVISTYAPTEDKSEEAKELFYEALQALMDSYPHRDMLVIAGDMNAQLGCQDRSAWDGTLGKFCLGNKATDNGTRLLSFCSANQLVVRSTFFKQKDIHLATWVGPAGDLANQIDHIIVRRSAAKYISNCRVMRGTSLESDHRLLRAECRFLGRLQKGYVGQPKKQIHMTRLNQTAVLQALNDGMQAAYECTEQDNHAESWAAFRDTLQSLQRKLLMSEKAPQKVWLTEATQTLLLTKHDTWLKLVKSRTELRRPPNPPRENTGQVPRKETSRATVGTEKMRRPHCAKAEKNGGAPVLSNGGSQCGPHPNCGEASHAEVQNYGQRLRVTLDKNPLDLEHARQAYRTAKNAARRAVVHDKQAYWKEMAAKLEEHFKKGELHLAYKEVNLRTSPAERHKRMPENMKRANGEIVTGQRANSELKKDYFSEAFECQ